MAPAPMLDPPEGWQPHELWGNLARDAHAHQTSLTLALALLTLLILGRALLPLDARKHLRFGTAFLLLVFAGLPVRALILLGGDATHYGAVVLTCNVFLVWGAIAVAGLFVFDLAGRKLGIPKILRDLTIIIASAVTLIVILSRSGVNLLSIVTTSAVLSVVLGLALQDTLGNLLSGVALQLESPFAIGDWIKLEDRSVGKVIEIRWRSTVIRTKNDDLVVIPNGMLAKGVVTLFNKDSLENRRWVYFNVHLRHAPNLVQKIVKEALVGATNVSMKTPPDCITWRYHESWLEYAVRYRLVDFLPDDSTDSEVRKRIWYALHRHQIEMPYPGMNIFTTELNAARDQRKSEAEVQRRADALAQVAFLRPLDDSDRRHLASGLRHEIYGVGEVIIRAGEPGDSLYLIAGGDVMVRIGSNGLEREVALLHAGDFFGEMSLMTGEPRSATVVAKSDVECYVIDRALFQELLHEKTQLVDDIGRLLHQRQVELRGEQAGLSAEEAARANERNALLGRIKQFFGLAA